MQRHRIISCAVAALLLPTVAADTVPAEAASKGMPVETVGKGEFPAVQLLPPGSELTGISLPRYENHRVASLTTAEKLLVVTNSIVSLTKLRVFIYDKDGDTIELTTDELTVDFATKRVRTTGKITITSSKFSGEGDGVVYSQDNGTGILKGPVRTTIRLNNLKGGAAPGNNEQQ